MIEELQLEERLLYANRTARVTKGGRRFSFSALVVVGDRRGFVGFGHGKAKEVPLAIAKAIEQAKKKIIRVPVIEGTVPHDVVGHFGPTRIIVIPARRGTGVVAGGAAKPLFELAGYTDVLTKIVGSPPEEIRKRYNIYAGQRLKVKLHYPWRGVYG